MGIFIEKVTEIFGSFRKKLYLCIEIRTSQTNKQHSIMATTFLVRMVEIRNGHLTALTSSYTTEDDNMTEKDIVDFYGLEDDDIISYTITKTTH